MKHYVVYEKATGRILRTGSCQDECFELQAIHAHEAVMDGKANDALHVVKDGVIVECPQPTQAESYEVMRYRDYPSLTDFADAYYWLQRGDPTKMDTYLAKVDAVKSKYSKTSGK